MLGIFSVTINNVEGVTERIVFPDGSKYVGEVQNGKMHGHGILILPTEQYVGYFNKGVFEKGMHKVETKSEGVIYKQQLFCPVIKTANFSNVHKVP